MNFIRATLGNREFYVNLEQIHYFEQDRDKVRIWFSQNHSAYVDGSVDDLLAKIASAGGRGMLIRKPMPKDSA